MQRGEIKWHLHSAETFHPHGNGITIGQLRTPDMWRTEILEETHSPLLHTSSAGNTYASGEKSFSLQTSISLGVSLYAFSERDPWAVFMGSQKEKEKDITEKFATVSARTVLVLRTLLLITQALKYEDQNK